MLPFLEPKKLSAVIIAKRKPSGEQESVKEEGAVAPELLACCEELIKAIHDKDATSAAKAFMACFEHCEQEPHEEGPHVEEEAE